MRVHVWDNEEEGKEAGSQEGGQEIQKEEMIPHKFIFRG
jgi:hypothetical protein